MEGSRSIILEVLRGTFLLDMWLSLACDRPNVYYRFRFWCHRFKHSTFLVYKRSLLQGTAGDMPCASTYALSCRADGLSLDSAAHLFVWSPLSLTMSEPSCTVWGISQVLAQVSNRLLLKSWVSQLQLSGESCFRTVALWWIILKAKYSRQEAKFILLFMGQRLSYCNQ